MNVILNPWPFDGQLDFQRWRDEIYKSLPANFMDAELSFIIEVHGVYDYWATKLFDRGRPAREAAAIIARAYYFHKVNNQFFN